MCSFFYCDDIAESKLQSLRFSYKGEALNALGPTFTTAEVTISKLLEILIAIVAA